MSQWMAVLGGFLLGVMVAKLEAKIRVMRDVRKCRDRYYEELRKEVHR